MKNWKVEFTAAGKFSQGEDPERYVSGRCDFAIPICNCNDSTQLHTQEVCRFTKS